MAMSHPELESDPRFANLKSRVRNMDTVDEIVASFTRQYTKQGAVRAPDEASGAVRAGARSRRGRERSASARTRALEWQEHPDLGRIPVPNSPLRYEGVEPRGAHPQPAPRT
jgi:formyl-CoA transferase